MTVDLHLHSTASDGMLTPAELVDYAVDLQLECLALTDHNTTRGLAEAAERSLQKGIRFIPGIELTALQDGREVHLLGYFIDGNHPALLERCRLHRTRTVNRLGEIIRRLNRLGIEVTLEEVLEIAKDSLPGRPHLARALVAHGHVRNVDEAFDIWLGNDGPVFLPVESETPQELYALLAEAGGIGGVAHPGAPGRGEPMNEADLAQHRDWGAKIVEVFHPAHTRLMIDLYLNLARKLDLTPTGGSDYHALSPNALGMNSKSCPSWVERELRARYSSTRQQ